MGMALSIRKPFTEVALASAELTVSRLMHGRIMQDKPLADDSKLVVYHPGFMAWQSTLAPIMYQAKTRNHRVYDWAGANRSDSFWSSLNHGPVTISLDDITNHLLHVFNLHGGGQPLTLVGHSLGGAYSMTAAAKLNDMGHDIVERIVTLGSPSSTRVLDLDHIQVENNVKKLFRRKNPDDHENMIEFREYAEMAEDGAIAHIPTVHIYSQSDYIVDKSVSSVIAEGRENIEVVSSHVGMPFHPLTQYMLMDRIEQPYGDFTPFNFEDEKHPFWVKALMRKNQWHEEHHPDLLKDDPKPQAA